jgi:hypothetical protein
MTGFGLKRKENPEVLVDPLKLRSYQERQELLNWRDGRGRDPLNILMRLEERAERDYDHMVQTRLPSCTRTEYRRAYLNRVFNPIIKK